MCGPSPRPEFEVDAGAEDVFVEAHDGARSASTVADGRAGAVRQVDEQIFDFGRPILCKGDFEPGADSPAGLGRTVIPQTAMNGGVHPYDRAIVSFLPGACRKVTDKLLRGGPIRRDETKGPT